MSSIFHYNEVIMSAMASQITSLTIVYSTIYSGADQRKHQSSTSLAFVWGIHRWPVNSPHKRSVKQKMFPFDDVIMLFCVLHCCCCCICSNILWCTILLWYPSVLPTTKAWVSINLVYWPVTCSPCQQSSWGQHGAHLGLTGPRWAPCWPHELCYLGRQLVR